MTVFWSQLRKGEVGNATQKKRLSKEEIQQQLLSSLIDGENIETEDLNKKADKAEKSKV